MATLEVAARADPALVFQAGILAEFADHSQLLPTIKKTFDDVKALESGVSVRLTLPSADILVDEAVVNYLTSLGKDNYSTSPQSIASAEKWLVKKTTLAGSNFPALIRPLTELDTYLTLRTYLVGYRLSPVDIVVWASLRSSHVAMSMVKKTYPNVLRWYNYIQESSTWLAQGVENIVNPATKARATASYSGAKYDVDLPQMDGPVVTRFPPEPSGYLHIGHGKAALLNDYFAHQKPGGVLICRFDDTNPSKESMEFQDAIVYDLKLMDITPDKTSFSSDYFQQMYEYAIQLIKDGKAFADDSELGKGDEDRRNRLPSKRRDLGIERTLEVFEEMKTGSEEGQRWCIRAKIAYDSPNGTLRDPVIYRCNLTPHHRTGTSWKIYPTYDFCAPILDSIEGVTLALRTNEYRDRNVQYDWFQDALRLRKVPIWDFSRMNFIKTVLSKRKLTRIVDEGKVWGWDDPRMPTIRGIIRRGMTVPALREFILKQGPSRNVLNLEWGAFWSLNRKYIDAVAPRHTAIVSSGAVHCTVAGVDGPDVQTKPKYIKNQDLGFKKMVTDKTILLEHEDAATLTIGDEITLMNWGNVYVRSITKDNSDGRITAVGLELHLEGDVKKTRKVTWLAATDSNMVPVDVVSFDYLITKNKLEKTDVLEECLTDITEFRSNAYADCNVVDVQKGAIIQFERKGYYILDGFHPEDQSRMVFFEIPSPKA